MGKIDELIKQFCPDGVKSAKLGDICNILDSKRKPITKGKRIRGNCPYYGANGIQDYVDGYLFDGIYLLLGEDGSVINNDKSPVLNWAVGKIWVNNHAHILSEKKEDALLRYLYYALQTCDVSSIVRGTPPKINQANLRNIEIPLPPLAVQKEIVEILDAFTGMIDNLQKELEQRQKQFEYYREILFAKRHSELKWEYIKNIALNCYAGATPSTKNKEYWEGGNIPWMSSGEVHQGQVLRVEGRITQKGYDHCSTKMVPRDSVVIALAGQGKTRGTVAITRIELCTNQSICAIVPDKTKVLPDYLYYYLKGQYFDLRRLSSGDGTRGGLNLKMINNYGIPIVSLGHQREIVEILDTFEALISNIKQEIELRQKQYEYYREKLLTFE